MKKGFLYQQTDDTICALSTPTGIGALAVIRISGQKALTIASQVFCPARKNLNIETAPGNTVHYGHICFHSQHFDDCLVTIFKAPHSYTGEDTVEFSCHGSLYIQQKVVELLISCGARLAQPGEFTFRAFMNHKFDLAQAEAVSDLISACSETAHELALQQMRGGFSKVIARLRQKLVDFASLIELELDFSEEDVEFADRKQFTQLIEELKTEVNQLIASFQLGNVIKHGIPVAIIGKPNVGKSTLLNALLREEKAIVSEIPGTTRDSIEDVLTIQGVNFRFIDTAGLRHQSHDQIENMGIEKTYEKIRQAAVILLVVDISQSNSDEILLSLEEIKSHLDNPAKPVIILANKTDLLTDAPKGLKKLSELEIIYISAKRQENINLITDSLLKVVDRGLIKDSTLISNTRHLEALHATLADLESIGKGIENNVATDLIATDIHSALHHLGLVTGEITSEELLGNIFSKFCIGK